LDHPNVGTVYEIGEHADRPFIAMALYEGETLKQRLARGALPVGEAVRVLAQIASGLAAAHRARVVHRDRKPANAILSGTGLVKPLDFGLAKLAPSSADPNALTRSGGRLGTPGYMSPEQLQGEPVDHRADLWALGALGYEMLTGRPAFAPD